MDVNLSRAANAYLRQMQMGGEGDEAEDAAAAGGPSFSGMLAGALEHTKESLDKSESLRLQAVAGKADIADLVTAVSEAELAVNTVVAVRDRVIGAYQEILRMPI